MTAARISLSAVDTTQAAFHGVGLRLGALRKQADEVGGSMAALPARFGAIGVAVAAALSGASLKSAIDMADQIDDLAEKTGIATRELSALRYAGEVVGTPIDALATGIRKLSQNMADAAGGGKESAAAFAAIGVKVKSMDGSLRGSDAVLGDLADRFAGFRDGPEKAALAMALFGKSGADMIPLLNQGAAGITKLREEGEALGAVFGGDVAKAAADFNDNLTRIGLSAEAAKVSIAAQLLPTLNDLAEAFVESNKGGGSLAATIGQGLATVLQTAAVLGANVAYVIKQTGIEIRGLAAQAVALFKLDFKGFNAISSAMKEDADKARAEIDDLSLRLLGLLNSKAGAGRGTVADPRALGTVESIAEQTRGWKPAAPTLNKAGESAKATASAYASLNSAIEQRLSLMSAELEVGRQLTDTEKFMLETRRKLGDESTKLTAAERAGLAVKLNQAEVQGQLYDQQLRDLEWSKQAREENERTVETLLKLAEGTEEKLRTQLQENETIGLTAVELARLEAARLSDAAASHEQRAATLDLIPGMETAAAAAREAAAAMRTLGEAKMAGAIKSEQTETTKAVADELRRTSDQIGQSLSDALMQGGKSAWEYIKGLFRSTVLRPVIQAVVNPVAGSVASMLPGTASAAGPGGSAPGAMGSLSSAWNMLNNGVGNAISEGFSKLAMSRFGESIGLSTGATVGNNPSAYGASQLTSAGSQVGAALGMAGNAMMGYGIYKGLSGGYKTNGLVDLGVAIGSLIPGIGPVIAGTVGAVINRAFGRKFKDSGLEGNFGGAAGFEGSSYKFYKGGWLRSDKTVRDPLDADVQSSLAQQFKTLQVQTGLMAQTLGLSTDAIASFTASVRLSFKGLTEAQIQTRLQEEFGNVGEALAQTALGTAAYTRAGETAGQTLQRLSGSLATTNAWLVLLRQRLFQVSLAGGDAASQLADAFGGLEGLSSAARAFYETYYTEGERAADSQRRLTEALAAVNLRLPESRSAWRALAEGLDLNTEAGRQAYAALLQLGPEFAATSEAQARLARETAERLLDTFSGQQKLVPLLSATQAGFGALMQGMGGATGQAALLTEGSWQIHRVLGEASSGVLYFGDRVGALGEPLTGAQLAAQALHDQVFDLRLNAEGTAIDIAGLSQALASVDTGTFVATVGLVFERLGERVRTLLGDISGERIATREAALSIINPTVMTRDQIARAIGAANVGLPSNAGVVAAQARLGELDRLVAGARAALSSGVAQRDAAAAALGSTRGQIDATTQQRDQTAAAWSERQGWFNNVWTNRIGSWGWRMSLHDVYAAEQNQFNAQMAQFGASLGALGSTLAGQQQAYDATRAAAEQYSQQLAALSGSQSDALGAARQAQLAYVDSLQAYAIDASRAVTRLGRLREETVKYYEEQKRLADLMGSSAAGLRQTVADYRYAQLTPALQLDKLQSDFSTAYALALSTSGETLAGYGDRLNGLLGPLLEKAGEVLSGSAYNALVATTLARAETVADRIEQLTPTDYATSSLALLGQIDTTLAALEQGAKSAEAVIAEAVKAGADQTTAGLRAVVAAISGAPIPAFAAGGDHAGGWRIVGERGMELEATGPARIFNAEQTRAMFAGGGRGDTAALEGELRALRAENRAQAAAMLQMQMRFTRLMERWDAIGIPEQRTT